MNNILKFSFAFSFMAHYKEVIPVMPEFNHPIGTLDHQYIPYMIDERARAAQAQLPHIQRQLALPTETG